MRPIHAALKRVRNSEFARSKMSAEPEVRFARKLASNDARTRNKAVKALRRWMTARSQVEDGEWGRVLMGQRSQLLAGNSIIEVRTFL